MAASATVLRYRSLTLDEHVALTESHRKLTTNTQVTGDPERRIKSGLLHSGLDDVLYDAPFLHTPRTGRRHLTDFMMMRHRIGGRTVVWDHHGVSKITDDYIHTLHELSQAYRLFVVLSSSVSRQQLERRLSTHLMANVDMYVQVEPQESRASLQDKVAAILRKTKVGESALPRIIERDLSVQSRLAGVLR